jgi:hypothetical protein
MLTRTELRRIARARLQDARVLLRGRRYDGAFYLCGYAVELALKARICTVLRWQGFPSTPAEFQGLASFKVHDLKTLLHLTDREARIKASRSPEWSVVLGWNPEVRYNPPGSVNRADAVVMINSVETLLKVR